MSNRAVMLRAIAERSDNFYGRTNELGEHASKVFRDQRRSQMTGLESIANSALAVSEVLDFVKKQTGKDEKRGTWAKDGFGRTLLVDLEGLSGDAKQLLENNKAHAGDWRQTQIQLLLMRQFVRQMVARYTYERVEHGSPEDDDS